MFDKVLVAVDLELEPARHLVERAVGLTRGELWVAHVVEPQNVRYSVDLSLRGSVTRAMERDALAAAASRLAEICQPVGIPADHQIVRLERAADGIHALAQELGVEAIVIGSHTRRGLARLAGSTANAVLHGAPTNVMTIRMEGASR